MNQSACTHLPLKPVRAWERLRPTFQRGVTPFRGTSLHHLSRLFHSPPVSASEPDLRPPRTNHPHHPHHRRSTTPPLTPPAHLHLTSAKIHCDHGFQHQTRSATRDTTTLPPSSQHRQRSCRTALPIAPPVAYSRQTLGRNSGPLLGRISLLRPRETSNSLWTCSKDNKSTYSRQVHRRRATPPSARRPQGRRWKESAPGMVRRCPAG